jgi:hypothetical protein
MVPDIRYDVQSKTAVSRDGFIHRAIQDHDEWLEVGAFASRSQPDSGLVAFGSRVHEPIHPKFIHAPPYVFWITAAIVDLPDRGAPFRITI